MSKGTDNPHSTPLVTIANALRPTCHHTDCKVVSSLSCSECDRPICVLHARSSICDRREKQCDACYECERRNAIWWRSFELKIWSLALLAVVLWECEFHTSHHHLEDHRLYLWTESGRLIPCPAPVLLFWIICIWLLTYFQRTDRKNWKDTSMSMEPKKFDLKTE